jgi:Flp pilus assembly protein TadD
MQGRAFRASWTRVAASSRASRVCAQAYRLALLVLTCCGAQCVFAAQCNVIQHSPAGDGEKAYLAADYALAETFFRTELTVHPSDAAIAAGLVHSLLRQEKHKDAADAIRAALAAAPRSAALVALRGELELRAGEPWIAAKSAQEATRLDPCDPRTEFLVAHLLKLNSFYATAQRTLEEAHAIDPADPEIRAEWMMTLPSSRRIAEIEAYLAAPEGDDAEETRRLSQYLDRLKATAELPTDCRLVSGATATDIPFVSLMRDATHIAAYGLDVRLNNRMTRLEIDTGASGIFVTAAVARHAQLKVLAAQQVGGVGDAGVRNGYAAWAESVRIGGLEFRNCAVQVVDTRDMPGDVEGLIGANVFAPFLVTLDYPNRKLVLGQLPPLPGEKGTLALDTGGADSLHDRYIAPEMKDYTKVYRSGPYLMLPARLNASATGAVKAGLFVIDTGSWATTISPEAAQQIAQLREDSSLNVEGMNGRVEKVYAADDITFGFAQLRQKVPQVIAFDTSRVSKSAGLEISGFLGASILDQLTIHLDYRDGLVKFDYDPGRGYHE